MRHPHTSSVKTKRLEFGIFNENMQVMQELSEHQS